MICLVKRMTQSVIGVRTMCSSESYEEAIRTLNQLQSNAAYIRSVRKHNSSNNTTLEDTRKYLLRSGLSLDELDSLRIIHVAGTKGKGSTCAFTESILRHHGFLTGFYSSPHLISVRERFRINGQPINESTFTRYFWKCYDSLNKMKDHDKDMPQYFKFLTIMMFHVFLEAKIDVAIIEVGIGGEYDCTNIIKNPICTGITSLGLDHTSLLGETIEEIAFQKSGIFKLNIPAFTVPQSIIAMNILEKRAIEKNCSLNIVPSVENYKWPNGMPKWKISQNIHNYNLSMAIKLSTTWMKSMEREKINHNLFGKSLYLKKLKEKRFSLNKTELALSNCKWPGRTQILHGKNMNFYIDGAHTMESMEYCVSWFQKSTKGINGKKFLIFNATGDRDPEKLLNLLKPLNFDKCLFTPNIAGIINIVDQENFTIGNVEQKKRCQKHLDIWQTNGIIVDNVNEAFQLIGKIIFQHEGNMKNQEKAQVLITGSLHLVGAALYILDPNFEMVTSVYRSGLTMDQVRSLRVIHIAGTKGKGSTCAFTESILRNHGYSTGFYSSPHLISVCERFRLNGEPISESKFSHHFWKLYKILYSTRQYDNDMPQYFKFLTIMMFHIFLDYNIDVAIVEVGIGGENDCTNIIENPICTGITSLALDHIKILGNSIDKIAFHKSGIFKINAPAFTVPQTIEAMIVLEKRALEKNCTLKIVPNLENYSWSTIPTLGIPAEIQKYNASLAIQLSLAFINSVEKINQQINYNKITNNNDLSLKIFSLDKTKLAISSCKWPGRTQILRGEKIDFFVDGAHTLESINCCAAWFKDCIKNESGKRYLIFNTTGHRDSEILMRPLKKLEFSKAFFSPNISGINNISEQDCRHVHDEIIKKCQNNCNFWGDGGIYVDNVNQAINEIFNLENFQQNKIKPKILVTGSLHLVGAVLSIIDYNLTMISKF